MTSSAVKHNQSTSVLSINYPLTSADDDPKTDYVHEGQEEQVDSLSQEELTTLVKEQRNYISILKTALGEVIDQNEEVRTT